nr:DUF4124 domain-containing protein [Rhodoferax sp.]
MQFRSLIFSCFCLSLPTAYAVDIYRWVDERGQVHMADTVPEKYRNAATKINSRQFELTPEQGAEAEARAGLERERGARTKAELDAKEQRLKQQRAEAEAELAKVGAAGGSKQATDDGGKNCKAQWQQFVERSSCYMQYRNANGGLRPGYLENCIDVQSPVPKCQIPTLP